MNVSKASKAINSLYKTYVYKAVAKDLAKAAKKAWKNRDDPEYFLHKVGLTKHEPVRGLLGGAGLFMLGALGGTAVALLLAPMPGDKMRAQLKEKTKSWVGAAKQIPQEIGARA